MDDGRYSVRSGSGPLGGYILRDEEAGSLAQVLPEVGANCVQFSVPGPRGLAVDLLHSPTSADELRMSPSRYGVPVLFPFPNRVRQGRYSFQGETYQLPVNSHGNAIHGLVIAARFRVEAAEATPRGAHLRCVIAHADLPSSDGYPFLFRLVLDFYLQETTLTLAVSAVNEGERDMPFGFGIHPYFNMPLAAASRRDDCRIAVPVGERWELDETLVPTGRRLPLGAGDGLAALQPVAGRHFDDVYGDVRLVDGWSRCRLVDPALPLEVDLRADAAFREIVVYAPPARDVICFEPYTCATDAFNLDERGIDAGRRVLAGGEGWSGSMQIVAAPA